ncbi:E3 SUMO-protein ligase ZBED1-like [Drosophila bipectinata]|uniref:E3 SUMO-protein ligase ZBED1-like n=1 Tax=Drosophila bipectinata TaxID=42026 RepID=UPI0038B4174C
MKTKLRDLLSSIKYCAITTDGWTSRANDHYLSVTCQFFTDNFKLKSAVLSTNKLVCDTNQNSENIADSLRIVLADWEIMHKVTAIVSNNASSMIKACKLLEKRHMPCFAHTLNLVVQDALIIDNVKEVITKCKRIVSFFKSNSIAYAKLKLAQGHDTTYGLIQEVSTRWNSCYKMIIRLLKLREAVSRVLLDTKKAPPPLTADEISILEDLERILEPFDGATNRVSGSTYETVSLIIPVSADIHHRLTSMNEGIEVRIALLEGVNQRLFKYESRSVTKVATILDPRFKKEGFRSRSTADLAVEAIKNELSGMAKTLVPTLDQSEPSTHTESVAFFSFMQSKIASKVKTPRSDAIIALRQYLENPHVSPNISPIDFWSHATEMESLKECALKYFCIPACSTESERTFSRAGCIVTDRRASLKAKNVDKLVFTSKNQWVLTE